jgi:hypothetical protein
MLTRLTAWICLLCAICGGFAGSSAHAQVQTLTAEDQKLDCPGVRAALADLAVQSKRSEAQVRKETGAAPATIAQLFQPPPPTAAAIQVKKLRLRSDALTTLSSSKGCNRLDATAKSRLGGAIAKPDKTLAERCDVRGELSLQDCAEDVAKWRCRADAGKGRAYLVCLDQTAERVITASGYDVTTLAHYDPGCGDVAVPSTCSVFTANRSGPETKWCKRTSETVIEVCDSPKAGTPAIAAVADARKTKPAAAPVADKPAARVLPPGTSCHPVACKLGTSCNRLCSPPD